MLDLISRLLEDLSPPGRYTTRHEALADGLHLDVEGVGVVRLPVSPLSARKLCAAAQPAHYGYKDQTLSDKRVRDTWEIPAKRLRVDESLWPETLASELERVRRALGLPDEVRLKAQLHNLLVYEKGQFFASHQDSEKADGMVATLVVLLPSVFAGGALVVEHQGERVRHLGSHEKLTFVAFYADCHHHVEPVKSGHRLALTYNLLRHGKVSIPSRGVAKKHLDELREAMRQHFRTAPPQRYAHQSAPQPPDRLVYLLDHQYTQKGLGWEALKNGDTLRVSALRAVADQLECESALALADVHESWSCEDEYYENRYRRGYRWGRSRYEQEEKDSDESQGEDDGDGHVLIELIDSDIELRHWVGASDNEIEPISTFVSREEVCVTKQSSELEPFKSQHEGYMGNYGNTVDRWYHRAALVLWPRSRTFLIRAKASSLWAARQLAAELKAGRLGSAQDMARQLAPVWPSVGCTEEPNPQLVQTILKVAGGIGHPALAATLVEPLHLGQLSPATAPIVRKLLANYGLNWCVERFERWDSEGRFFDRHKWIAALPTFCANLAPQRVSNERALVRHVIERQLKSIVAEHQKCVKQLPGKYGRTALRELVEPILGLLEAGALAQDSGLQDRVRALLGIAPSPLLTWTTEVLRSAKQKLSPETFKACGLGPVLSLCHLTLKRLLATPTRSLDDWSIEVPIGGHCALCKQFAAFLASHTQVRMDWPLAKDKRAHIHQMIDGLEVPVRHETMREGRPYTLALTKTRALFEEAAAEREAWRQDADWISAELHALGVMGHPAE